MLHTEKIGGGDGERIVLLHGFTQSARAWGEVGRRLGLGHDVTAVDAPGHGRSAAVEADLAGGADLMAAVAPGRATWLGYSMGGRYALHVALRHTEQVERLVLVSTTAGIDDAGERSERRRNDEEVAARVLSEGVEPFVRWWLGQPLFASLPAGAAQMEGRLDGTAEGLASSLRLAGTGTQEPLWERLGRLRMPVLVVAGSLDTKYRDLARRLASAIGPNATTVILDGAGHACHLEQPARFVETVTAWLDGHPVA